MPDIPMDVLLRGPAAVAAWLEDQHDNLIDATADRTDKHLAMMRDALAKDPTPANLAAMLSAATAVAVIIMFVSRGGMRGPARDALSEVIDGAFDDAEDAPEELLALVRDMHKRARR